MRSAIVYSRSWWPTTRASKAPSRSRARSVARRSSVSITPRNHSRGATVASRYGTRATPPTTASRVRQSAAMSHDDRYDDLIASLGGFHRTWLVYLGLELGLFEQVRAAREVGITTADLAAATGTQAEAVEAWAWASDAHELTTFEDGRLVMDDDVAAILLDGDRADFLGGQFVHAV